MWERGMGAWFGSIEGSEGNDWVMWETMRWPPGDVDGW